MVKERDEQMIEAEKKEREEKIRRRKEWWGKFKRGTARVLSVAFLLAIIGGIGLFTLNQDFIHRVTAPVIPFKIAEEKAPDNQKRKGVRVTDERLRGKNCQTLRQQEVSLFDDHVCRDMIYITTRNLVGNGKDASFGLSKGDGWRFGTATMVAPITGSKSHPDYLKFHLTESAKEFIGSDAFDEKRLEYKLLGEAEYSLLHATARPDDSKFIERGLTTVREPNNAMPDQINQAFSNLIAEAVAEYKGNVLLYVHGFNQSFDQSLMSSGILAEDLLNQANIPNVITKNELGLPVAYSWPTRVQIEGDDLESALAYLESQVIASEEGNRFFETFSAIAKNSGVKRINILAHSMGNRLVFEQLERISKVAQSEGIEVQIISMAGDFGQKEARKILRGVAKSTRNAKSIFPRVYFYASAVDSALNELSLQAQQLKYWARNAGPVRWLVFRGAASEMGLTDEQVKYAKQEFDRIKSRVEASGIDADEFYTESYCRVGTEEVDGWFECRPFIFAHPSVDTVMVDQLIDGFGADVYRHGYFEQSPMVMADAACALGNIGPDDSRRSLKKEWLIGSWARPKSYWRIIVDPKASQNCKSTGKLYAVDVDYRVPEPPSTDEVVVLNTGAFWSFKEDALWIADGASAPSELPSLVEYISEKNDSNLCLARQLIAVGVASHEGGRNENVGLAKRRAANLAVVLSEVSQACKKPPKVTAINLGQACSPKGCDVVAISPENESDNSFFERPIVIALDIGTSADVPLGRVENDVRTALQSSAEYLTR
nr:alpha/beta hydrolase [Nitrosomonas nitrosa]